MNAIKIIFVSAVIAGLAVGHGDHELLEQPQHHAVQRTAAATEALNKQYCYYYSCSDCSVQSGCGWCDSTSSCQAGNSYGPSSGTCYDWKYTSSSCSDPCSSQYSCSGCTAQSGCGWCGSSQTCKSGTSYGPASGTCSSSWAYYYSDCSSASCTCDLYEVYSCPTGYDKKGDWCDSSDKCCGLVFDCCTLAPWMIASSIISPVALLSACILACCCGCSGCPVHNARLRRRQAAIAAYQQQGSYMPAARAQAIPAMPQPVYSTVTVETNNQNVPLVNKC